MSKLKGHDLKWGRNLPRPRCDSHVLRSWHSRKSHSESSKPWLIIATCLSPPPYQASHDSSGYEECPFVEVPDWGLHTWGSYFRWQILGSFLFQQKVGLQVQPTCNCADQACPQPLSWGALEPKPYCDITNGCLGLDVCGPGKWSDRLDIWRTAQLGAHSRDICY